QEWDAPPEWVVGITETGGRLGVKSVVGIDRNGWSASTEIGGRHRVKSVVVLRRNTHEGIQPISKLSRQFQDADQFLNVSEISASSWGSARSQFQLDQAL